MTTSTTLAEDRVRELIAELRTGEHATRLKTAIASFEARIAGMKAGPARDNEVQWQAERHEAQAIEAARADACEAILSALQSERLRAEEAETQLSNIRVSFETRGELIENDPFPLWMQVVAAFDQQQARLQALTLERDAMREGLTEAGRQIDYLQTKFRKTGSGNAVLARIEALLAPAHSSTGEG